MRLKELAKEVSKEIGIPAYQGELFLKAVIKVIRRLVLQGHVVILSDLLTLRTDVVKARKVRDLHKKKVIDVPRKFKLKITFSRKLKDEVNAKKAY